MEALPPHPFGDRRAYVQARLPDGAMILPAAPMRYKSGDSEYRYRGDSELFYLTGWQAPDCIAVIRGFHDEERFILFVPERDPAVELWSGPRLGPEEAAERYGADAAYPLSDFESVCGQLLLGGDRIYYRLGADPRCDAVVRRALEAGRRRRARLGRGPFVLADPGAILIGPQRERCRAWPHQSEITVSGLHFIQEDYPHEIGQGISDWYSRIS